MLKKQGNKTLVTSSTGKVLGTHESRKKALHQLRVIEWSKHAQNKFEDGGFITPSDKSLADRIAYIKRLNHAKTVNTTENDFILDGEIRDQEDKVIDSIETPLTKDEVNQKKRFMEERKKTSW